MTGEVCYFIGVKKDSFQNKWKRVTLSRTALQKFKSEKNTPAATETYN